MGRGRKKNTEKEEATYSIVEEGNEIIKKLCEKYPDILWACDSKTIQVYGIDNKEKPASSSNTLAKIRSISGVFKAVLEQHNIKLKYIIEVYWSDYREWSLAQKQWVLLHECLHICDPESKKMRKHNIEDFAIIIDKIGISQYSENLPDLLGDKPIEFDKKIVAQMMETKDEKEDEAPTPPE